MDTGANSFSQGRLPADVTSFVGRQRATTHVRHLLSESRLITLTGVGGVGKSRLALHVARQLRRAFPDGVLLVELAKLDDPALVGSAVLAALGLTDTSAREHTDVLIDHLEDKRLLLVMDNCEHLLTACARLVATLLPAAPGLRVLATSREPLGIDGEQIWRVPPLSVPGPDAGRDETREYEALTLFEERAAAGFALDATNRAAVAELCRQLDGLPLAIELAAAVWLRTMSVEEILRRLPDRFDLPANAGAALARHRTLLATVEWSFELCSAAERRLWARLSVFAGEFDLDAADAVCGDDVLGGIAGLLDKSILIRGGDGFRARYRMLETIRQYGAERLTMTHERDTLRRRHRDYYLSLVERADAESCGPLLPEWTARLSADRANLWAALDYCLTEPGESRTGLRMAASLWPYWVARGFVRDGRHWLDRALALDTAPSRERARALWVDGWIAYLQADKPASLALLEESRELSRELGDAREETYAIQHLGMSLLASGVDAVALVDEALARHRRSPWTAPSLLIFVQRAGAAVDQGDYDLARTLQYEGVAVCESLGESFARAWIEWNLGILSWVLGKPEQARHHLRESIQRMVDVGDRLGFTCCVEVSGWVAVSTGDLRRAAVLFGAADRGWTLVSAPLFGFPNLLDHREECRRRCRRNLGERAFGTARLEGARLDQEQVENVALGGSPESGAPPGGGRVLTAREAEIAGMIAQGMSNRDIASALVIAQRTVEGHVEHMLRKLGFGSRSQIAAWISEHPDGQ
jgi:predicted ATPase/DNA-binding CsgD family transcriptional regulator